MKVWQPRGITATGRWVLAVASVLVTACSDPTDQIACTAEFVYGIRVEAVDAVTRSPVTEGLAGTTTRGSVAAPMEVAYNFLLGAGETPGTFTVAVSATGYDSWTRTDVVVDANVCHVIPVLFTAELQPTTAP